MVLYFYCCLKSLVLPLLVKPLKRRKLTNLVWSERDSEGERKTSFQYMINSYHKPFSIDSLTLPPLYSRLEDCLPLLVLPE